MVKRGIGVRGQSSLASTQSGLKRKIVRGLGLVFFLIGAFFILNSVFSITGNVAQEDQKDKDEVSILGLVLEVIGVTLMMIRINGKKLLRENHLKR